MKRDYRDENFEEFLKRSADNLRMKAPDKVWENLSAELNKRRRRFGYGLSAFFLLASVFGYLTISTTKFPVRGTSQPLSSTQAPPASAKTVNVGSQRGSATPPPVTTAFYQRNNTGLQNKRPVQTNRPEELATENRLAVSELTGLSAEDEFTPTIVDAYSPLPEEDATAATEESQMMPAAPAAGTSPWTIESATNAYLQKRRKKESRFQTQFHFTPTISYRKLSENKSYLRHAALSASPANYSALYSSVNSMVTHKPDMGFELGVTEKYSLSPNLRIRAGLQFNVNRYEIKAFEAPYALATIALNNRRTATVDSVFTIANYSNVDVFRSNRGSWLQNYSFQVSAPVGIELALKGNEDMQFGIAASLQPTYVLGDRAYMITSDYKSYTQVPSLQRRWNVNTALEAFVQYQKGRTRWQVGPQVRYQLLSSYITNYPVKENLFDFGLKIGVSVIK